MNRISENFNSFSLLQNEERLLQEIRFSQEDIDMDVITDILQLSRPIYIVSKNFDQNLTNRGDSWTELELMQKTININIKKHDH